MVNARLLGIRILNCLAACRRGASAVEFALLIPAFLLLTMGAFEMGRALWVKSTMQYAVEEATRYAMVQPSSGLSATALESYAQNKLLYRPFAEMGGTNQITFTATVNASDATVAATYNYQFIFNIDALLDLASGSSGSALSFTINATSTVPLIN